MAVELGTGYVTLTASAKGIGKSITSELGDLDAVGATGGDQAAQGFMGKFKSGIGGIAATVGGVFAAAGIAKIISGSIAAASDLAETTSKVGVIFGGAAAGVETFASTSATAFGQSKQQALDAAATFAVFGKSAGLSGDDLSGFSTNLVGLSADMASFSNTSPEQAIEAIGAALRGESEPIRQYGVLLDEATLRNRALKLGLIATTKDALTPQQKVLAAQAEILAQTADAQGDFARTADGAANKQRILSAEAKNASAEFGQALMPIYAKIVTILAEKVVPVITKVTEWMSEHKGVATAVAIVIGGVLVAAFVAWAISAAAAAVATLAAAAPFIAIGLAIAALAAGIIYAYNHFAIFRTVVDTVWQVLQAVFGWLFDHWQLVLGILTGPFGLALLFVIKNFDTIKDIIGAVIGWITDHWQLILAIITGPIGLAVLFITSNFGTIKDAFTAVKDWIGQKIGDIVGFFTGLPGRIIGKVDETWEKIKLGFTVVKDWLWQKIEDIVGFFLGIPGRLANSFGGMFDGIADAFRGALNWVIGRWNGLEFKIPSFSAFGLSTPGFTLGMPDIPYLAAGGVATQAMLAVVGEKSSRRNPEITAPQSAIADAVAAALRQVGGATGGGVTINATTTADAHDIGREVQWQMKTAGV